MKGPETPCSPSVTCLPQTIPKLLADSVGGISSEIAAVLFVGENKILTKIKKYFLKSFLMACSPFYFPVNKRVHSSQPLFKDHFLIGSLYSICFLLRLTT